MNQSVIQVYCNPGEDASEPWHVGLKNGRAIDEHFGRFRNPITAINYALDVVAEKLDLPVKWPESVVIA